MVGIKPNYLRTIRKKRGLTQEQLERIARIAQNTISRLEADSKARPVFATVVALAGALQVDPMSLRFGPDPRDRRHAGRSRTRAIA